MTQPASLLIVAVGLTSCSIARSESRCRAEAAEGLDYEGLVSAVRSCAPEQKMRLYLKWAFEENAPEPEIRQQLASVGAPLIPVLMRYIEHPDRSDPLSNFYCEHYMREALIVLDLMRAKGIYKTHEDSALLARIDQALERMNDPQLKHACKQWARALRHPEGKLGAWVPYRKVATDT